MNFFFHCALSELCEKYFLTIFIILKRKVQQCKLQRKNQDSFM